MIPPIPVFILSGFLGAGKTTLLNYILHHQTKHKIAVIENELGNAAIDTTLLSQNTPLHITTLQNGCICCSSHGELEATLQELTNQLTHQQIDFTQLIIECTGMADPGPILHTFLTHDLFANFFQLKGVITLVDALNAPYQFKHFHVTQAQIGFADLILVSKTDLLQNGYQDFAQQLTYMNTKAEIYPILNGEINLELLHQLDCFSLSTSKLILSCQELPSNPLDTKINSFIIKRSKPFEIEKLSSLFEKILYNFKKQLLRYKAIIYIKDTPERLLLQGVQQLYSSEFGEIWSKSEVPFSEFVFIGVALPEQEFRKAFEEI